MHIPRFLYQIVLAMHLVYCRQISASLADRAFSQAVAVLENDTAEICDGCREKS